MKAYKFRLYPSKKQEKLMYNHLRIAKDLWNMLIEANKKHYKETGKFLSNTEMQKMTKKSGLYAQTAQEVSHRLNKALWRMIGLKKQGKKCGFPRFKSIDRMKSMCYPQYPQSGFWFDKKLKVTPFGEINIKKHREINGKIKNLTLKRESSGKWFAIFYVEQESKQLRINNGEQVGLDLGLKTFATLSNGETIKNPRHFKQYESKLAELQRRFSRTKKGSKNRQKEKLKTALIYEKISNTRNDFLHKESTKLVNSYSLIALEKLAVQDMAEQRFGKYIYDAGWGMFANMLSYKAEEAGCKVIFVNPHNTTKQCNNCGAIQEMPLSERIYYCGSCGMLEDRDLNAAKNILEKATAGQAESNASGVESLGSTTKEDALYSCKTIKYVTSSKEESVRAKKNIL